MALKLLTILLQKELCIGEGGVCYKAVITANKRLAAIFRKSKVANFFALMYHHSEVSERRKKLVRVATGNLILHLRRMIQLRYGAFGAEINLFSVSVNPQLQNPPNGALIKGPR